jgi:hypothetical protein
MRYRSESGRTGRGASLPDDGLRTKKSSQESSRVPKGNCNPEGWNGSRGKNPKFDSHGNRILRDGRY